VTSPAPDTVAALLANRRYALYLASRVALILAAQMVSVAVGWQVYEITGTALALGFSGLALFLPGFFLALPSGHVADRHDRRRILATCHVGVTLAAVALAVMAKAGARTLLPIYATLAVLGAIRSFSGPASQALMPSLVGRAQLERAVALGSSTWQLAMIAGPALGGVLYAATGHAWVVYAVCAVLASIAATCVVAMGDVAREPEARRAREPVSLDTLLAGVRYVWSNKTILGAISLDLFAVLLGGAVALLPIFARDYLHIGPWGLGVLRSAPAVGASAVALLLARFPLRRRAGAAMLAAVAVFGLATIVFGLSRSFALSVAALLVLGGADMISVVVRSTLIQTRTPDAMRGRVGAVSSVFIGASNELGEFESGVTAAWLGPVAAVVVGGVGTCVVVVLWPFLFRDLAKIDRLTDGAPDG
jgi:MFS family permease